MRASTAVAILSLAAGVALSVALPLPAFKYASLSCCMCDAQGLSFFIVLSVPVSARLSRSRLGTVGSRGRYSRARLGGHGRYSRARLGSHGRYSRARLGSHSRCSRPRLGSNSRCLLLAARKKRNARRARPGQPRTSRNEKKNSRALARPFHRTSPRPASLPRSAR